MKLKLFVFFNFFLLNYNLVITELNSDDLDAIIIISKHCEKGIEISYPNDKVLNNDKIWKNGLEHLTDKGKEDCKLFGKLLKEKYGQHFKHKSDDLIAIIDSKPFSAETVELTLLNLFDSAPLSVIDQTINHDDILNGPKDCKLLNHKLKSKFSSSKVKKLFKLNKKLIQNITDSNLDNSKLIANIPAIYESIQIELNNNLALPVWLNKTTINELKNITTKLDKIFYTDNQILQLQIGQLLKEIRVNLIENTLKLPNPRVFKLCYFYVINSDQFTALSYALGINENSRFDLSYIIELDKQSNIKINYFNSNNKQIIEKQFKCEQQDDVQCKLVPFLKSFDKLIPISKNNLCTLKYKIGDNELDHNNLDGDN